MRYLTAVFCRVLANNKSPGPPKLEHNVEASRSTQQAATEMASASASATAAQLDAEVTRNRGVAEQLGAARAEAAQLETEKECAEQEKHAALARVAEAEAEIARLGQDETDILICLAEVQVRASITVVHLSISYSNSGVLSHPGCCRPRS